jgi:hypothetical protein
LGKRCELPACGTEETHRQQNQQRRANTRDLAGLFHSSDQLIDIRALLFTRSPIRAIHRRMSARAVLPDQLRKIPYVDVDNIGDRFVLLMPLWDGTRWRQWVQTELGEITIFDAVRANYVAKASAAEGDLWIPFVDFMWQHASWSEIGPLITALCDDIHNFGTCAAKLKHFTQARGTIGDGAVSSFVETELEYLLILARTVFDLLQETIAVLWNGRIQLLDEGSERRRAQHQLPNTFSRLALRGEEIRTEAELIETYALPPAMAQAYARHALFFVALRRARDRIVHGSGGGATIFVTERGFCVFPRTGAFALFDIWKEEHNYNGNIVTLLPWVAHVVFQTIAACTDLMHAFASQVRFPPAIAPGYRVFVRDEISHALLDLLKVHKGEMLWWEQVPVVAAQ